MEGVFQLENLLIANKTMESRISVNFARLMGLNLKIILVSRLITALSLTELISALSAKRTTL